MISISFLSLTSGKLTKDHPSSIEVSTMAEARAAVEAYAHAAGYTNVKYRDGEDCYDGGRFTATTPGGRAGRNVAMLDFL